MPGPPATSASLETLTIAISNAISPSLLHTLPHHNISPRFVHRCEDTQHISRSRQEFHDFFLSLLSQFPAWDAKIIDVSTIRFDEEKHVAGIIVVQEIRGVAPSCTHQCSTIFEWRLSEGGKKWVCCAASSIRHPFVLPG